MRPDQAIKRLRAWHSGKPLPAYSTRHFAIADVEDALIVAFVRMGGEAAPWGIASFETLLAFDRSKIAGNHARLRELVASGGGIRVFSAHDPVELERFQRS